MKEPRTLPQLWRWAYEQGEVVAEDPPSKLHTKTFPRDASPGNRGVAIIRGWPFTVAFESWLMGKRAKPPIVAALNELFSRRDRIQSLEFEIVWAVVMGRHGDREVLREMLGCSADVFEAAASRGLAMLYSKTTRRVADDIARSTVTHRAGVPLTPTGTE